MGKREVQRELVHILVRHRCGIVVGATGLGCWRAGSRGRAGGTARGVCGGYGAMHFGLDLGHHLGGYAFSVACPLAMRSRLVRLCHR